MVKMWNMYRLVDNQVETLAGDRVVVSNHTTNCLVRAFAMDFVISVHIDWSVEVLNNQSISAEYACVSMRIKFQCCFNQSSRIRTIR